ncbi:hypothetical protein ThrDRAFT_00514 [Frankia casuarinae]|nr:hypothetical protein CcI6DRAFT_00722 [Frankia sp. CcI6]EYT93764.1 hypothetical protein ThrDRAFT_00514 [Frankia casuarinae]KDA44408.1 hypothetical protein BMG523Draft_00582 [Frankia sp. BMG5.23]OAA26289.1 hypothetical protein AAY23_103263 [Frankia casuarinae]
MGSGSPSTPRSSATRRGPSGIARGAPARPHPVGAAGLTVRHLDIPEEMSCRPQPCPRSTLSRWRSLAGVSLRPLLRGLVPARGPRDVEHRRLECGDQRRRRPRCRRGPAHRRGTSTPRRSTRSCPGMRSAPKSSISTSFATPAPDQRRASRTRSAARRRPATSRGWRVSRSMCQQTIAWRRPALMSSTSRSHSGRGRPEWAPTSLSVVDVLDRPALTVAEGAAARPPDVRLLALRLFGPGRL